MTKVSYRIELFADVGPSGVSRVECPAIYIRKPAERERRVDEGSTEYYQALTALTRAFEDLQVKTGT